MITISEVVRQIISESPFLEEGISQGLINYSALARKIKPDIEATLYKSVQTSAIIMALNRISQDLDTRHDGIDRLQQILEHIHDISLRSNLVVYTLVKSFTLPERKTRLTEIIAKNPYCFIEIMDGIFESAFYMSHEIDSEFKTVFSSEIMTSKRENVSAITVRIPKEAIDVPGVYYALLKKLAWNGINIIDIMSSFTEFTIFVDKNNTDRAFSTLKNTKNN